jgi:hypothetical protein
MLIILVGIIFCGAGFRHGIDSTCSFCLPVRASVPPATFPYTVLGQLLAILRGYRSQSFSEYGTPLLPISAAAAAFHSSVRASSFLAAPMCDGSSNRVIDSMSRTMGIVPMSSPSVTNNQHLSVRGEREQHGQRATDVVPRAAGCVERGAAGSSTTGPPRSPSHTLGESLCRTWSWTASTSRSPERTPRASAPCASRAAVSWTAHCCRGRRNRTPAASAPCASRAASDFVGSCLGMLSCTAGILSDSYTTTCRTHHVNIINI